MLGGGQSRPLAFTGSEYSAITVKSSICATHFPLHRDGKLKPISKHKKAQNAKESHQKFAEELLEGPKMQTSASAPSI